MSAVIKARSKALANVARLLVAAERHGQTAVAVDEIRVALAEVDVESLADPRPCVVRNVGRPFKISHVTTHTNA